MNGTDPIDRVPSLVRELYATLGKLRELFPGRPFTLDGHPVGSVGEVLVAHDYGLKLLDANAKRHDAVAKDGRKVQIKATQGNRGVAMRSSPDYLIVVHLCSDGTITEVYNGPGEPAWNLGGIQNAGNGQRATIRHSQQPAELDAFRGAIGAA